MHRITRYPLLFKRLLENIDKKQLQYSMIETLIFSIENKISTINEMVRKSEAKYRIGVIENSLEWNNIFPVSLNNIYNKILLYKIINIYIYTYILLLYFKNKNK